MRMVKKKRRHNGHYCKICGCYKSNESFTGKGHARHICKQCQSLPKDEQADMMRCNEVERAAFRFPMRRQDWELLEKYAKKYKDRESGQFAQDMLDMKRGVCVPEDDDEETDEWDDNILQVVMYAWEHGFEKKEVRQWLNRQLARYQRTATGISPLS